MPDTNETVIPVAELWDAIADMEASVRDEIEDDQIFAAIAEAEDAAAEAAEPGGPEVAEALGAVIGAIAEAADRKTMDKPMNLLAAGRAGAKEGFDDLEAWIEDNLVPCGKKAQALNKLSAARYLVDDAITAYGVVLPDLEG